MKELMRTFKALADTTRVRIIKMLQKKSLCVCELQEILGIAQSSVSRHLKILEDAGLVEREKCGQWVNYQLITDGNKNPYTSVMLHHLDSWLEDHTQTQMDRELMKSVNRDTLCTKRAKISSLSSLS
ncbi:MAG: metalloregulator ArsR/SmtB family transcription factor [bacterium]